MSTTEDLIKQMYDSQFASQKEQLQTDYDTADSDLNAQKQQAQQQTDANLTRTAVESQKAAVNNSEYYAAAGLTSGARAQARLAQENQLQADLTALRAAQQQTDAQIENQRSLLAREYAAAIRQAQAENDLAKAQALYENAKEAEQQLLAKQEAAANLMASAGDYTRYGDLYGLSADEIAYLQAAALATADEKTEEVSSADDTDADGSTGGVAANNAGSLSHAGPAAISVKNTAVSPTGAARQSNDLKKLISLYNI